MLAALAWQSACSRQAEIEALPEPSVTPTVEVPLPADGLLVVETNLDHPDGLGCNQRPTQQACAGTNDFLCDFERWLEQLTSECQQQTDCRTDGWVEVALDENGCASELRMEFPNPPFADCLSVELRKYQCRCPGVSGSIYLGLGHSGCDQCGGGELRCRPGLVCRDGECVVDDAAAGGAP